MVPPRVKNSGGGGLVTGGLKARVATEVDIYFMRLALREAGKALALGEVPVGAVAVEDREVVARAFNLRETSGDPTAHAEVLALRQAAARQGGWRLQGVTIYVTLEPCVMCAGAMVAARLQALVFGVADPRGGAAGSIYDIADSPWLNHRLQVRGGILEEECSRLLEEFFTQRRGG